jgi:hypothetical protein
MTWLPETGFVPDHAPPATHEVALVEDQVRVEEPPFATTAGDAVSATVGWGGVQDDFVSVEFRSCPDACRQAGRL